MKQNFKKKYEVVTGKTPFFKISPFCRSLLNCVPYVLTCQHTLRAYVLTCLACLRVKVPCVLTYIACLLSNMPCVLMCSRANVLCVLTCQRVLRVYVLTRSGNNVSWVPTCYNYMRQRQVFNNMFYLHFCDCSLYFSCEIKLLYIPTFLLLVRSL